MTSNSAILNLHERIENKLFLDRTRKDSNFKRPHICATLFQIDKCCLELLPLVVPVPEVATVDPDNDRFPRHRRWLVSGGTVIPQARLAGAEVGSCRAATLCR